MSILHNTYKVAKVLARTNNAFGKPYSYVQWEGYSATYNTWIPDAEVPLDCEDIRPPDQLNFRCDHEMLSAIRRELNCPTYRVEGLIVENYFFQTLDVDKPGVFVAGYRQHAYLLASYRGKLYIADGANVAFDSESSRFRARLTRTHGVRPIPIWVVGQLNIDHCASSLVVVALELIKLIRRGADFPEEVFLNIRQRNRLANSWHPYRSARLYPRGEVSVAEVTNRLRCPGCNRVFRPQSRLNRHKPKCPGLRGTSQ